MTTRATVNKSIKHFGDIELVKGDGYFYFVGGSVNIDASGVYVYSIKELTLTQWIEEAKAALTA